MPKRRRASHKSHSTRNAVIVGVIILAIVVIGSVAYTFRNATTTSTDSSDPRLQYLSGSLILSSFPFLGSKNATVTIFQFGDFQCTSCDYWFKTQEQVIIQNLVDTGKAKLVWRDYDWIGPDSFNASRAAYAAGAQGKFWQFYNLLYTHQGGENSGWASSSHLISFAKSLGLNMAQFNQSFTGGAFDSLINSNKAAGNALGISGTPTFFLVGLNGQVQEIVGPQPESVFASTVDSLS